MGATTQWQGISPAPLRPWAQYPEAREQNKQNTRISIWKFLSTKVKLTVCAPRLEITLYPKREKKAQTGKGEPVKIGSALTQLSEGEQTRVQPFLSFSFVLIFKVNMTIMVSSWCPVHRCSYTLSSFLSVSTPPPSPAVFLAFMLHVVLPSVLHLSSQNLLFSFVT